MVHWCGHGPHQSETPRALELHDLQGIERSRTRVNTARPASPSTGCAFLVDFTRSARSPHLRPGISALVAAVAVFLVIGLAVGYLFLTQTPAPPPVPAATSSTTASTGASPPPSTSVKTAVEQWVSDFNARDGEGLGNFYTQESTVVWSGNAAGLAGTYTGRQNILILFGSSIGKTNTLNVSISDYAEKATSQDAANVTMIISFDGYSTVVGTLNGTVQATQEWQDSSAGWQIVKENWNYQTFIVQYPVSATTFPQWGALKTGQNPNLVSEKSFEWHAGPWVAASVYAALFAVLAIGVIRYRGGSRSPSYS